MPLEGGAPGLAGAAPTAATVGTPAFLDIRGPITVSIISVTVAVAAITTCERKVSGSGSLGVVGTGGSWALRARRT